MINTKNICRKIGRYLWLLNIFFTNLLHAVEWTELNDGAAASPTPRTLFSMVFNPAAFPNGQIVLFGGQGDSGPLNDTWVWNDFNNIWNSQTTSLNPSPRNGVSMAFDPTFGQTLLFGGTNTFSDFNDTWLWNGNNSTWTELIPNTTSPTNPSPRAYASMAFAPLPSTQLILFGGSTISGSMPMPLNDTWAWNGTAWIQIFPIDSPSPRFGASMVFDQNNQSLLLFGGSDYTQVFNDTWSWNGINWIQLFPSEMPSPRALAAMTFDASIMRTLLFGGTGNLVGQYFGDTWLWSGSNWQLATPTSTTNPSPRSGASMVFDAITQKPLLFGGNTEFQSFNDTWTLGQLPQIISLTPNSGPLDGGTEVTITGFNLNGTITVNFGNTPAINFTVISSMEIQALSPPLELPASSATVDVTVTTTSGISPTTVVNLFTYTGIFSPIDLGGFQIKNKFLNQTDLVNIITWKQPLLGEKPVLYKIYRDENLTTLVATIKTHQKLEFLDHNRKKGKAYSYFIVSISDDGDISSSATITVKPLR